MKDGYLIPLVLTSVVLAGNIHAQSLDETAPALGREAPIIAEILLGMEHFPSDEQKQLLQKISDNEAHSQAIRTIAEAVHDFQHTVQSDDARALEQIANNEYATAREKILADVILEMQHRPNAEQTGDLAEVE